MPCPTGSSAATVSPRVALAPAGPESGSSSGSCSGSGLSSGPAGSYSESTSSEVRISTSSIISTELNHQEDMKLWTNKSVFLLPHFLFLRNYCDCPIFSRREQHVQAQVHVPRCGHLHAEPLHLPRVARLQVRAVGGALGLEEDQEQTQQLRR